MTIFSKAAKGLNLTPGERALLKALKGLVVSALIAALPILQAATTASNVNWLDVARVFAVAFATSLVFAVVKFVQANYDSPLVETIAPIVDQGLANARQAAGIPNDVKIEPPVTSAALSSTPANTMTPQA